MLKRASLVRRFFSFKGIYVLKKNKSVTILYHFFYPDDVVSARLFSDMAEEMVKRGWQVKVLTSNRYCRYPGKCIHEQQERWKGMDIVRVYRPNWNQAANLSRIGNALWLFCFWLA